MTTPETEATPNARYSLGMLLRHVPLSLWRMRRVVAEMQAARAGWGAFVAITLFAVIASLVESAVRDPGEYRRHADAVAAGEMSAVEVFWAHAWPVLQFFLIGMLLVFVWWGTARLLRRRVTLRQSVVGVAAGGLPQIAISLVLAILILPAFAAFGADAPRRILETVDWLVTVALWGYGVVAYAAATGLNLTGALLVQLVGVIGFVLVLFAVVSLGGLGGLAIDQWLSGLTRLVLG